MLTTLLICRAAVNGAIGDVSVAKLRILLLASPTCPCGHPLLESELLVRGRSYWGVVHFLACPECGEPT